MAYEPHKEKESFTPEMLDYLGKMKKVVEETFSPYRIAFNANMYTRLKEIMPKEVDRMFSDLMSNGLIASAVPKEFGGKWGFNCLQDSLISYEKIRMSKSGFFDCIIAPSGNFEVQCVKWSTYPDVKQQYMTRLLEGGRGTFYITDPDAGVDSGAMNTTAVRDGDSYVINGPKWWMCGTTPGFYGKNFHILLAKTDPSKRSSGISTFIIDHDTDGQVYGREGDLSAQRFDTRHEITLQDLRVPANRILGQEGEGLRCLQDGINYNTVWYSYHGCAYAETAIEEVMEHAKKSVRFGSNLYEFQGIHYPIAEMIINAEVGRAMAHKAADLRDQGDPSATLMGTISLRYAGPMAISVCTKAMELLAGRGVERGENNATEQLLREAFIINLFRTPNLDKRFIASHYLGKKLKAGINM
ncbi:acyl-CoA dehydrogenase family protein [Chloroflexota bacterium]